MIVGGPPLVPDVWSVLRGLPIRPGDDGGLINLTWYAGDPVAWVAQRLHPAFRAEVHEDIEAITAHLAAKGLVTPRLVRTDAGELSHTLRRGDGGDGVYRVMDYVPGHTHHRVSSAGLAGAAGALVARFHAAVDDLEWSYRHVRPGAHDTPLHMSRLEEGLAGAAEGGGPAADARRVADGILEAWRTFPSASLPTRHAHGDLKISNLRFDAAGQGVCLLDLDTLSALPLDVELGDALRSWCNPKGEDDTDTFFDIDTFAAAIQGYTRVRALSAEEREALPGAAERIALELASRFCRDVWDDNYFGWNAGRFPSRAAHNLFRARGQLSLARSARSARAAAARLLHA
ncbi:MAG: phosphotransferase [Pseudomonadota bacterium]|nr:phosphotransferase [Pseudomonadota bacterium]